MNLNEINQLIATRRSHFSKEFNGKIAPNKLIQQLLMNANWAPSHKLTLPWHFVVFEGQKIEQLVSQIEQIQIIVNPDFPQEKREKIRKLPQQLSHAIAICLKPSNLVPLWEEYCSLGAAVQNMYLTLNSVDDFGGYWTSGNATNTEEMKKFLEIEPQDIHLGFFFIGGIDHKRTNSTRKEVSVIWK
jgi:nitroreductase